MHRMYTKFTQFLIIYVEQIYFVVVTKLVHLGVQRKTMSCGQLKPCDVDQCWLDAEAGDQEVRNTSSQ